MSSRREFLKQTSLLAGGTGLWANLPASIQKALTINPHPGTTYLDAEHIVILMQENRSFDHCFGTLQGARGFNDPRAITIPGRIPVWAQLNEKGERYAPFRLNMKDTRATWIDGLPHSWTDQVDARNRGRYDKWLVAKKKGGEYKDMPFTMGYYIREDIPFYYALADAFTVCDQNFSSSLTGTTANRSFHWTGTIKEKRGAMACVRNSDTYYNKEAQWKTYPERLEENGISWKVYQNELSLMTELEGEDESWLANFTNNNLEWFTNYNVRFHKASHDFIAKRTTELPGEIEKLKRYLKGKLQNEAVPVEMELKNKESQLVSYRAMLKRWSPENWEKLTDFQKSIHEKAFDTNKDDPFYHQTDPLIYRQFGVKREIRIPKGDIFFNFRRDVNDGKLPVVSWLVAPQNFSDHPSAPWFGAWYVSEVLDILTKNPEIWKKTIFIINYDENDGYFDHQPPFTAPKQGDLSTGKTSAGIDTSEDYVTMEEEERRTNLDKEDMRENSIGLGYRVPLIVASPWSRGGWINSQVFDITSTLQFIETFLKEKTGKDIRETNISNWRRTITGDLTSVFRPYNGEPIRMPAFLDQKTFVKEIYNAKFKDPPSDYQQLNDRQIEDLKTGNKFDILPGQEKGVRPSCNLPYELDVDGRLNREKHLFEVHFKVGNQLFGEKAAGAPFNVYAPGRYGTNADFQDVRAWAIAVKAGDNIDYQWPLSNFEDEKYDLKIYGPNGYFRSFEGDQNDPLINIVFGSEIGKSGTLTGNITISVENTGLEPQRIKIADNSYGNGFKILNIDPGDKKSMVSDLRNSYSWYDVSITTEGYDDFKKQYAGRVETGKASKTDPLMGGITGQSC